MKECFFSIIIPIYNGEKTIKKCVYSVLNQNFQDYEIILVDDGSKDRSADIIKYYEKKYKGIIRGIYQKNQGQSAARNHALEVATKYSIIRYVYQENQGVTAARKKGLDNSKGCWVFFLDCDDTMFGGALCFLYSSIIRQSCDMVIAGWHICSGTRYKRGYLGKMGNLTSIDFINGLFDGSIPVGILAKVYKKKLFMESSALEIPANFTNYEDCIMNIRFALNAKSILALPSQSIYCYTITQNSASHRILPSTYWDSVFSYVFNLLPISQQYKFDNFVSSSIYHLSCYNNIDFSNSYYFEKLISKSNTLPLLSLEYNQLNYIKSGNCFSRFIVFSYKILRFIKKISIFVLSKLR